MHQEKEGFSLKISLLNLIEKKKKGVY